MCLSIDLYGRIKRLSQSFCNAPKNYQNVLRKSGIVKLKKVRSNVQKKAD